MVHRMIGLRVGTDGAPARPACAAPWTTIFSEIADLSSFLFRRNKAARRCLWN